MLPGTTNLNDESHLVGRLYPPRANLTSGKGKFQAGSNDKAIEIFVSGSEAERQRNELKKFGFEVALILAERRTRYNQRLSNQRKEEQLYIQVSVHYSFSSSSSIVVVVPHLLVVVVA